jgi:RNA polymerase sigma-70 factor (ECF subfamily)
MIKSESKLIRKVKKGCRKSADVLIAAYYDEIYIYTCRQLGDKQLAMDITQEIFITAWQAIGGFDESKAGFRTWLYRIATNKIIDYRRKHRPETIPFEEIADTALDFAFDKTLFIREIEAYISTLPPDTSRILRLHIYGGYSFPEITEMLKQSEAKIKSQYYRAIKQVRKEFFDHES